MTTNNATTTTTTATRSGKYPRKISAAEKATQIILAWGNMAPESKFAGMTVGEFQSATESTRSTREEIAVLRAVQKGTIAKRMEADKASAALLVAVVAGVKADPYYGNNSSFYRAMGFIPASERKPYTKAAATALDASVGSDSAGSSGASSPSVPRKRERDLIARADRFISVWSQFAPEATFARQTLAGFTAAILPSRTHRESFATNKVGLALAVGNKNAADRAAFKLIKQVVCSIKGDVEFGSDSPLYRALGYKTDAERSAPRRKNATAAIPDTGTMVSSSTNPIAVLATASATK